jgi:hypothetical protein
MPNTIRSWVQLIGDVKSINGPEVVVTTMNTTTDNRVFEDDHPVLIKDDEILKKVKIGKKLGFAGIIRRIGNRTKLILDPVRYTTNQSKLKGRYLNTAGISGHVVFKQFFGSDPNKRQMLTVGIGEPNATGTALYGSIWRDMAAHWNSLLTGFDAVVELVGYMRSREMTGARAGDTMYELIANREKSNIVSRNLIKTGFEDYNADNAEALMALEFDVPDQPASNPANAEAGLSDHTDPNSANDDIPF